VRFAVPLVGGLMRGLRRDCGVLDHPLRRPQKLHVNVAMPHLRGKRSPTEAILRTLGVSFMRHSFAAQRAPTLLDSSDSSGLRYRREMKRIP